MVYNGDMITEGGAKMKQYTITIRFLTGVLKGLEIAQETDVLLAEGREYGSKWSRYVVVALDYND